jgi:hypothetical protein
MKLCGVEFGEKDLKLAFDILRTLKEAHIDGVVWSWHSIDDGLPDHAEKDWRDKFLHWWAFTVMTHPDNPYKEALFSIIYELDSNLKSVPEDIQRAHFNHLKPIFSHFNFWRKNDGTERLMKFSAENELWDLNLGYFSTTDKVATEAGVEVIFQDFFGSEFLNSDGQYETFSYGFPFWDIRPSGLHITDDIARVTIAYKKQHENDNEIDDIKEIPFEAERLIANITEAINSGRDVLINSLNEWWEFSNLLRRKGAIIIFNRAIPNLPEPPPKVSADMFIDRVSDLIEKRRNEVPQGQLPPAQPKEIPVFSVEARRRKDEDLDKPILIPKYRRSGKAA